GVIEASPHLCDDLCHLVASRETIGDKPLSLALQLALVLDGGHPCVDRHPSGGPRRWLLLVLGDDNSMRPYSASLDFAVTEPAPGGLVPHAHLFGIVRELHAASLPDCERIVKDSL